MTNLDLREAKQLVDDINAMDGPGPVWGNSNSGAGNGRHDWVVIHGNSVIQWLTDINEKDADERLRKECYENGTFYLARVDYEAEAVRKVDVSFHKPTPF